MPNSEGKVSLAEKHNNPGNVKSQDWIGEIGKDEKGHAIFDIPEYGVRAMFRTIHSKMTNKTYPKNTITLLIAGHPLAGGKDGWAPASDGNDPEAYITFLSVFTGIPRHQELSLFSTDRVSEFRNLINIAEGISYYEAGYHWLPQSTFLWGLALFVRDFLETKKGSLQ